MVQGKSAVALSSQRKPNPTDNTPYRAWLYRSDGTLRYVGQMIGRLKEGWGTAFCKDGHVIYEGDWHQGKRHGHGSHMNFQGEKLVQRYTGEWKQGKRDGYGRQETYTQCNIDNDMMLITIHDGCWKEDKFHGWGRLFQYTELEEMLGYASGVDDNLCYEGTWLDNLQDGVGIAIYSNGDRFEGVWREGQRNGRGRYWFAKDDSCLKGIWINDVFKSGIYTSKDQEIKDRREHSNVEILEEFKNQEDLSSSTTTSYEIKKSVEAATTQTDISGNVISAAEPPAQCG